MSRGQSSLGLRHLQNPLPLLGGGVHACSGATPRSARRAPRHPQAALDDERGCDVKGRARRQCGGTSADAMWRDGRGCDAKGGGPAPPTCGVVRAGVQQQDGAAGGRPQVLQHALHPGTMKRAASRQVVRINQSQPHCVPHSVAQGHNPCSAAILSTLAAAAGTPPSDSGEPAGEGQKRAHLKVESTCLRLVIPAPRSRQYKSPSKKPKVLHACINWRANGPFHCVPTHNRARLP
jgi:hypothetical protein